MMMKINLSTIDCCRSTNETIDRDAPHGFALLAREQTAGRGRGSNSWESEPSKNILLSLMLRPEGIEAARQFQISEAVCLGIVDLLTNLGIDNVSVKWPNDVYVGDCKIAGILIENSLCGTKILRSIAGIGLNVNQTEFRHAPNPISIKQLTGIELPIEETAVKMIECILSRLNRDNHADYCSRLWRKVGIWEWIDNSTGEHFSASITDVLPTGQLCLSGHEPCLFGAVSAVI